MIGEGTIARTPAEKKRLYKIIDEEAAKKAELMEVFVTAILALQAALRHSHAYGTEVVIKPHWYPETDVVIKDGMAHVNILGGVFDRSGNDQSFHFECWIFDPGKSFQVKLEVMGKNYCVVGEAQANMDSGGLLAYTIKT